MLSQTTPQRKRLPPLQVTDRFIATAINGLGVVLVGIVAVFLADALVTGQTERITALAGILAVVVVLMLHPPTGLLLWMVLAPFGALFNLSMGHGLPDLSLNRVAGVLLFGLLAARFATGKRALPRIGWLEVTGGLFLLGMAASVPASRLGVIGGAQSVFDRVALPLLCFLFGRQLLDSHRGVQRLSVALAVVGATLGAIAVREQLTNEAILSPVIYRWAYGQYSVKITSLFGAPAIMALTMAIPVPLTFINAMRARGATQLAWLAALIIMLAGLLMTYVRAGWLAAVVGILLAALLSPSARRFAWTLLPVALVIALIFISGAVDVRAITERLQSEGPINYRLQALEVGLQIARRAPIFGLGLDSYSDAALAAGWRPLGGTGLPSIAPHNLFIYVLTSAGLVGLLPLLLFMGSATLRAFLLWRRARNRDWLAALLATLAGYFLFANTFDALGAALASILLLLTTGAILGAAEADAQVKP